MNQKLAHGLRVLVRVVLVLTGVGAILGVALAIATSGSYADGIAAAMWVIGFIVLLGVSAQIFYSRDFVDIVDSDPPESESRTGVSPVWPLILFPAGVVVIAIGTIVSLTQTLVVD